MTEHLLHALTFDVEEYFHVANLQARFPRSGWDEVPSRLDVGMQAILGLRRNFLLALRDRRQPRP